MSKWKEKTVQIVQAFQGTHYGDYYGLGTDDMLYKWSQTEGAWEKFWLQKDKP